jgi:thiol-disulfide isomerase/thioredoxin
MKFYLFAVVSVFFFNTETSFAQHSQPPASEIMREAMQMAAKENKNVFIIFHASWCGWCHKMDNAINDKSCKDFFYKNYVIRHLVVDESKDKKDLENPGADELRTKYHGDDEGIPFWLIFDKDGNLLADSQRRSAGASLDTKGENIACPASEKEVNYFIEVLKKTSQINEAEQTAVQKRFRQNENN